MMYLSLYFVSASFLMFFSLLHFLLVVILLWMTWFVMLNEKLLYWILPVMSWQYCWIEYHYCL